MVYLFQFPDVKLLFMFIWHLHPPNAGRIARLIGGFLHRSLLLNHLSPPPQKPHDTFILCNPKTYLHRVLLCNPHFEGKTKVISNKSMFFSYKNPSTYTMNLLFVWVFFSYLFIWFLVFSIILIKHVWYAYFRMCYYGLLDRLIMSCVWLIGNIFQIFIRSKWFSQIALCGHVFVEDSITKCLFCFLFLFHWLFILLIRW